MIRYTNAADVGINAQGEQIKYVEGFCNSTDTKPVDNIGNGSNLIESDTGDWYFFNEETRTWSKMRTVKE